jgi:hypothetical protein
MENKDGKKYRGQPNRPVRNGQNKPGRAVSLADEIGKSSGLVSISKCRPRGRPVGTFLSIQGIAGYALFGMAWSEWAARDPLTFISKMPESLMTQFSRQSEMSGSPAVRRVIRRILRSCRRKYLWNENGCFDEYRPENILKISL